MAQSNISAVTADFMLDEETGKPSRCRDNQKVIVGGMITEKTIKYTKNNKTMAFYYDRGSVWNGGSYCIFQAITRNISTLFE